MAGEVILGLLNAIPGLTKAATALAGASSEVERNKQLLEFQQALIGLQGQVASVQAENARLQSENRDALEQIKRLEHWDEEKKRYAMVTVFGNVMYALLKESASNEPAHYLCANCYQTGKKSIVGKTVKDGWVYLACPNCKTTWSTGLRGIGTAKYAEDHQPES